MIPVVDGPNAWLAGLWNCRPEYQVSSSSTPCVRSRPQAAGITGRLRSCTLEETDATCQLRIMAISTHCLCSQATVENLGNQPYLDNLDSRSRKKQPAGPLRFDREVDRIFVGAPEDIKVAPDSLGLGLRSDNTSWRQAASKCLTHAPSIEGAAANQQLAVLMFGTRRGQRWVHELRTCQVHGLCTFGCHKHGVIPSCI